ncbi:N-acetylmuramoyl-L-alanine amidase [Nocardia sp. NPDC101769]|uniref:N-acetylmuramoyl-L-alanine amidase n=1 Tax=Nocardia sp. NPDC101769 TaxID=3364333 RepID=UPI00382536D8
MKPSITKAGIFTVVTAAAITTVAGIVPVAALAAPALPELPQKLAGKTIFLDPGHQGPNHTQDENKQVSNGRGGTKACETTGMTSLHGIAEHTINWNVAQLVRTSLEGLGAHVVMSRPDDIGWGGCIDDRAKAANASGADIALSIHADSGPADGRGFHLIVPALPVADAKVNEVQSGAGLTASKVMRDAYVQSGYQVATYNGAVDGLQTRSDIAGPALTTVPDVFLEMGNGANAEDAQQLETPEGQLKHAVTITTGIASYLLGVPVPADTGQASEPGTQPGQQVPVQPARTPQAAPTQPSQAPASAQTPQAVAPTPQAAVPQVPRTVVPAQAPQTTVPAAPAQPGQTQPGQGQPGQAQPGQGQPGQGQPGQGQPGQGQLSAPTAPAPAQRNPAPAQQPGNAVPGFEVGPQFFQQLAEQLMNSWGQSQTPGQPGTQPQTAPQAGTQPQAAEPAQTNPAVQPIADQRAPQWQSPGTLGGQGTPATPDRLGTQSILGPQAPVIDKNSKSNGLNVNSVSTLMQMAVKFLGPLANMLTGDSGLASGLVNLAYTVVSVLGSTLLSAATK